MTNLNLARTAAERPPILDAVEDNIGFVPNLFATLAATPGAAEAFIALDSAFSASSLTPTERQIVLLTASLENDGRYCVAGHTVFANSIGVPTAVVDAIRSDTPLDDDRLAALSAFVRQLVRQKGQPTAAQTAAINDAGFAREQIVEIILGIALKTISNYVDNSVGLVLDEQFLPGAWAGTAGVHA